MGEGLSNACEFAKVVLEPQVIRVEKRDPFVAGFGNAAIAGGTGASVRL